MSKKELSYAEAIAEVEKILEGFDNEEYDVDLLLEKVKRATELIRLCRQKLRKAEEEVAEVLKEEKSE